MIQNIKYLVLGYVKECEGRDTFEVVLQQSNTPFTQKQLEIAWVCGKEKYERLDSIKTDERIFFTTQDEIDKDNARIARIIEKMNGIGCNSFLINDSFSND